MGKKPSERTPVINGLVDRIPDLFATMPDEVQLEFGMKGMMSATRYVRIKLYQLGLEPLKKFSDLDLEELLLESLLGLRTWKPGNNSHSRKRRN